MEEITTTLTASDGTAIFARAWVEGKPERVLVCVQGLGGHGGYYEAVARYVAPQGTVVVAPDLRGHGLSHGKRGDIDHFAVGADRDLRGAATHIHIHDHGLVPD